MKRIYLFGFALVFTATLFGQSTGFRLAASSEVPAAVATDDLPIADYQRLILDLDQLRSALGNAPLEFSSGEEALTLSFPAPNGGTQTYRVEESPVMPADLSARFPLIKSYRLHGPHGSGRLSVSPEGASAALMGPDGEYFITPAITGNAEHHLVYKRTDFDAHAASGIDIPELSCGWDPAEAEDHLYFQNPNLPSHQANARSNQALLGMYVYDLAMVCTGEFASLKGGTIEGVMAAFNDAVSFLNAILEREVAARFMLISNTDQLIFLDANSDPFTNANDGQGLLSQIGPAIGLAGIPQTAFDLAHLFTGGCAEGLGGIVGGAACTNGKTRGVTCNFTNNLAFIVREIMAHEIAHQFSVGHSWNNCPPSLEQLASGSAFEPGSGSTIMSYSGTCNNQNIQSNSDDYYHVGSLNEFIDYTRNIVPGCATILEPVNNEPEITLPYEDGFFIPISTPFSLTGSATDMDGDMLRYNWEQYDLGPVRPIGDPTGNAPIFRSFPPSVSGATRVFPRIDRIVNNINSNTEVLPTYSRDLTFRLTVRDYNENAGAAVWETVAFESTAEAGPFLVMSPNEGPVAWTGGDYVEVTWDVANTDQAPVNCQTVNILLSSDGGFTYPITLADGAPNTGSTFVTVPVGITGSNFRVKVEAADNIFFDISNESFDIVAPTEPNFTIVPSPLSQLSCLPAVSTINFDAGSVLSFDGEITLNLISELPDGVTAEFNSLTMLPGDNNTLTVTLPEIDYDGPLELMIEAVAEGVDTAFRTVVLDVVNNDFSDLSLVAPFEGQQGISLATPFDWTDAVNANNYEIEIGTSPDFTGDNLFEASGLLANSDYDQDEFFATNTIYFWRVRPVNECGPGPWADPASFRTVSTICTTYDPGDLPIGLPGNGPAFTRSSTVFIDQSGIIDDVNIPNISLVYSPVRNIKLDLVSPAGTRVTLYDENCFFTTTLDIGFDDEAPLAIVCPPDDQRVFNPEGDLSAFIGENTFGSWTLEVIVDETGGSAGSLDSWEIEFCAATSPVPPVLLVNNPTDCPPNAGTNILATNLQVTDDSYGPDELEFTLVRAPRNGFLRLGNDEISAGATFTQADISNGQLYYRNTNPEAEADNWSFIAQNPEGGYIPVNYHEIRIFDDAISSVEEFGALNGLEIFPNPVNNQLQLRWRVATREVTPISLFDVAGRPLIQQEIPETLTQFTLNTQQLPSGVYFLRIGEKSHRIIKQ